MLLATLSKKFAVRRSLLRLADFIPGIVDGPGMIVLSLEDCVTGVISVTSVKGQGQEDKLRIAYVDPTVSTQTRSLRIA
jgi:hypothetical protein